MITTTIWTNNKYKVRIKMKMLRSGSNTVLRVPISPKTSDDKRSHSR